MKKQNNGHWRNYSRLISSLLIVGVLVFGVMVQVAMGATSSGNVKVAAKVPGPPPSVPSTITSPKTGDVIKLNPVTVKGDCPEKGLVIKIIDNGHFAGSAICGGSSFSLNIDLFIGKNTLVAQEFDSLNQQGPDSAPVIISFSPSVITAPVSQVIQSKQSPLIIGLDTKYNAYTGCLPGQQFSLPLNVSGGTSPYAVNIDWGDGSSSLVSLKNSKQPLVANHSYQDAGNHQITITVSDAAGQQAMLSLVVVIDGAALSVGAQISNVAKSIWHLNWYYQLEGMVLLMVGYFLGRYARQPKVKAKKTALKPLFGAARRGP